MCHRLHVQEQKQPGHVEVDIHSNVTEERHVIEARQALLADVDQRVTAQSAQITGLMEIMAWYEEEVKNWVDNIKSPREISGQRNDHNSPAASSAVVPHDEQNASIDNKLRSFEIRLDSLNADLRATCNAI